MNNDIDGDFDDNDRDLNITKDSYLSNTNSPNKAKSLKSRSSSKSPLKKLSAKEFETKTFNEY